MWNEIITEDNLNRLMAENTKVKNYYCRNRIVYIIILSVLLLCLTGCFGIHERLYYMDTNNYITGEALVDNIIYNEEEKYIVFWLNEISEEYQTSDFIVRGKSAQILIDNGVFDKVEKGDTIQFTSAPRIFGNGYFMPIVELIIDGNVLLKFEDGYKYLMTDK